MRNLSSASVLHVLRDTMAKRPPAGSPGVLMAMGPGFCSELVFCVALTMIWYTLLIAAIAIERIAELVVSKRNWAWSRERGGAGAWAPVTIRRWSSSTSAYSWGA